MNIQKIACGILALGGMALAIPTLVFAPSDAYISGLQGSKLTSTTFAAQPVVQNLVKSSLKKWIAKNPKQCPELNIGSTIKITQSLQGSFTKPNSGQTLYLYAFCQPIEYAEMDGPQWALAIVEQGKLQFNAKLATPHLLSATAPDLNANGYTEVLLTSKLSSRKDAVSLVEFAPAKATTLAHVSVDSPGFSISPMYRACFSDFGPAFPKRFNAAKVWAQTGSAIQLWTSQDQVKVNCEKRSVSVNSSSDVIPAPRVAQANNWLEVLK